jgi:hypothetical protein
LVDSGLSNSVTIAESAYEKDWAGTRKSRFQKLTMSNNLFRILALSLASTAMFLVSPLAAQSTDPSTDEASFRKLIDSIFPAIGEEKWRQTPWIPSISSGRRMAQERKRPMFLWAMNGDPLGCV